MSPAEARALLRGHGRASVCTLEPKDCLALADALDEQARAMSELSKALDAANEKIAALKKLVGPAR